VGCIHVAGLVILGIAPFLDMGLVHGKLVWGERARAGM